MEKDGEIVQVQHLQQVQDKNRELPNFSDRWIIGAESLRTSNIRDHRKDNYHALAMSLLIKERVASCGQGPSSYVPIMQASL